MVPLEVDAGEVLMREGDAGDRYCVIETGSMDVSEAVAICEPAGPPRGSARSRYCVTWPGRRPWSPTERTRVLALDALSFKAAMAGPAAWAAAEATVADRLAASGPSALARGA